MSGLRVPIGAYLLASFERDKPSGFASHHAVLAWWVGHAVSVAAERQVMR